MKKRKDQKLLIVDLSVPRNIEADMSEIDGLDFSWTMLENIRGRFPDQRRHRMDMRTLSLSTRFEGIIAWHSFFHLNHDDQELTLHKFVEHLEPEGVLLLSLIHI